MSWLLYALIACERACLYVSVCFCASRLVKKLERVKKMKMPVDKTKRVAKRRKR